MQGAAPLILKTKGEATVNAKQGRTQRTKRLRRIIPRDLFVQRLLLTIAVITGVILLGGLIVIAANVLLLVFLGIIFGMFLLGLRDGVERYTPLKGSPALAVVLLGLFGAIFGGIYFLGPQVIGRMDALNEIVPSEEQLDEILGQYSWGEWVVDRVPSAEDLEDAFTTPSGEGGGFFSEVTGVLSSGLNTLANIVLIIFIGIYIAVEPQLYRNGILKLIPTQHQQRAYEVSQKVSHMLQLWLFSRFVSMVVIGFLTVLGLAALGVPLPVTLGILTGLITFIPTFGPILSFIPTALIALNNDPSDVLWVAGLYVGVQLVETYLITPLVERRTVSLPPALVLSTQLVLGALIGFLGLVLAPALVVVAMVLVEMLYVEDVLGQEELSVEDIAPHGSEVESESVPEGVHDPEKAVIEARQSTEPDPD